MAAEEEEEETPAGWRSPERKETGPNQHHVTNALNSESHERFTPDKEGWTVTLHG